MAAPKHNENNLRHGASGLEARIYQKLPLAEDDKHLRDEIISKLGPYDSNALPSGPLGYLIDLVADNVLLALRFRGARHYAAEKGDLDLYATLAQRSGWRNDKAINQLVQLLELQSTNDDSSIEAAINSARGNDDSNSD